MSQEPSDHATNGENQTNASDDSQAKSEPNSSQQNSGAIGLEQLIGLLSQFDPIEIAARTIDVSRRGAEAIVSVVDNLTGTLENLNRTTKRIDALLDEIEEPLKRLTPQVATALSAMASLGDVATQLADVSRKLNPLISLAENAGGLFGFKPPKSPETGTNRPG